MVVFIKAIEPKTLKIKAMRLELLNAMRKAGVVIRRDFRETTATWKHKVEFEQKISLKQPGPTVTVWTDDEIYNYVDKGTRSHRIQAGIYTGKSNKKVLAFPSAFTPKTKPGSLRSGPGRSGGPTVFTPFVEHPGGKARNFSRQIAKKDLPVYKRIMEEGMKKARDVSGNPI